MSVPSTAEQKHPLNKPYLSKSLSVPICGLSLRYYSFINSPTSTISVGSKKYHVHESLLRENMPVLFEQLQDGNLKTRACRLDDWTEDIFDQVVLWLYQGRLQVPAKFGLIGYTDVYRFAKWVESETLQNFVVDATRKYCRNFQISRYILKNYAGMLDKHIGGPMSKFLIDQLAYEMVFSVKGYEIAGSKEDFELFFEKDPKTAVSLTFTLKGFQERKFKEIFTKPSECFACVYHEHSKTPSCESILSKRAVTDAVLVTSHSNLKLEPKQPNQPTSNPLKQSVTVRIPFSDPSTRVGNAPRQSLSVPSRPANTSPSSGTSTTQSVSRNVFDDAESTYTSNW
jgi:hypothetical protein